MATLDLRGQDSLSIVQLGGVFSHVGTLNISGLTKMKRLNEFGKIDNFIARNCPNLTYMNSGSGSTGVNYLFDVTGCVNLDTVMIYESNLQSMDFSTCPNLKRLFVYISSPGLEYLNLKNGTAASNISIGIAGGDPVPVLNVCADDFEVADLQNNFANYVGTVNLSPFCSFFPGGNYNTISGKIGIDLDDNGCSDADPGMANLPVRIISLAGDTIIKYTNTLGKYVLFPYAGDFTITPYFPYPYFSLTPTSGNINFNLANSLVDSINFCVEATGVHNDLEITCLPQIPARPGMIASYNIVCRNKGNTIQSGMAQLNFDNNKMNFNSSYPAVTSQAPGQLSWAFTNLLPFESRTFYVSFNLQASPINNIGDTLMLLATINPVSNDETPFDNSFILPQQVRSSFDPNDKLCLEGSKIVVSDIGKYLHYIIHFQNLGDDTAFNVVVADTLAGNLDWSSFDFIAGSHPCEVQRNSDKLLFYFKDIHLPYASINEPASHGYVAFKIKPKNTLIIGDTLNNKASIYFDFNTPVVTNTASTIVVPTSPLAVKLEYFALVKKDESNQLAWKAPSTNGITDFEIERSNDGIRFTNIGNVLATVDQCQSPFYFTDTKPFNGKTYYRLNITDADGISFYSKVLVAERTKPNLSIITAIVSDRDNTIVYFNASKEQTVQMKMIAADGRLVYNQTTTIAAGSSTMSLQVQNLSTGIYTLVISTPEGKVVTKRFVK